MFYKVKGFIYSIVLRSLGAWFYIMLGSGEELFCCITKQMVSGSKKCEERLSKETRSREQMRRAGLENVN